MSLWCLAKKLYCSEAKLPSHCGNIGQRVTDKLLKVANCSAARISGTTSSFSSYLVLLDHCFTYKVRKSAVVPPRACQNSTALLRHGLLKTPEGVLWYLAQRG